MSEAVFLGIDVGTQSVRVMAVTNTGDVVATASRPLTSQREGDRHEQDPEQWWSATAEGLRSVTSALGSGFRILGIAVDATSGTILLANSAGRALTLGLMYDDSRAVAEASLVNEAGEALWEELSYRVQPSWALPKLLWLVRNGHSAPGAKLLHQNDWINARLAGRLLATDSSNALKTGYDLLRSAWPQKLFENLGLPAAMLPDVVPPGTRIGEVGRETAKELGLQAGTPIYSGMTDGCAAQIASGATGTGDWNTVVGTTLVVKGVTRELLHDPLRAVYSHRSLDGCWLPGGASSTGAGSISAAFSSDVSVLEKLNQSIATRPPTKLVVYPLAGQGERFPFASSEARGFVLGMASSVEEKYQAVLQGIALWERLCFDSLRSMGAPMNGRFTISGGATRSMPLNRMRADVLEKPLTIPAVTEGAFGMAVLIAAAQSSLAEAAERMIRPGQVIEPGRAFSEYVPAYERLTHELHSRGWLPDELLRAVRTEVPA